MMRKDVKQIVDDMINTPLKNKGGVYFIGIGGIGMSALARFFNSKKIQVSGYDKTETALTKLLNEEGIAINYEDDVKHINTNAELVIYTPAIPAHHQQLNYYLQNNFVVTKRSDVLGAITNSAFNICIAGTHGKTTTSAMIAHILTHTNYGCNTFLGGIAANYNTNFWSSDNNVCVVEADEYDRSFLKLNPDVAIITSMDADHLDIYNTVENVEIAFVDFSKKVKQGGLLISKLGMSKSDNLEATNKLQYHLNNEQANIYTSNIQIKNGTYQFDVTVNDWFLQSVQLNMGGLHNIENMIAAIAVAHHLNIADEKIKAAVNSFKGVKRRFEYIVKNDNQIYIDDYAHHPDELLALLNGVKNLFPDKKIAIVFQPHLFSRTKDFADEFAKSLSIADEIILLPIYPARELPIQNVTSTLIVNKIEKENKKILSKDEVLEWVKNNKTEVLITAGAGDIDTLVQPIKNIINN
jgi:UDP-N-acetylmuramate--alanine ligase